MRILIITISYAPDLGPSGPLFTLLSTELAKRGHEVRVITAVPHYPSGIVPQEFKGKFIQRSVENNVFLTRVGLPSLNRANFRNRLLQFICFQLEATLASLSEKYDVVLITNPALETWLPFAWSVVLRQKPSVFSVHDVFPDVGIKLGILKNKSQIAFISWLERFCVNRASLVRILSDSFTPGVRRLGVPESKMKLVYDWVDTNLIQPLPQENSFSKEFGFSTQFVVMYAGNIGLSQGLEHILTTAEILTNHDDIRFVFVGDGTGKELLQTQAQQRKLVNVQFIPFQPRQRLPELLASADVSLVILRRGMGLGSLPSKTFSIMASGRPILVSIDEASETWKLVERANAGLCVPPENPEKLAEAIISLRESKELRDRLGSNGRTWAMLHHSPQIAADQFEEILEEAIARQKE